MLKCDFHMHTKEDPEDCNKIKYDAYELIDFAAKKKFDVLSITLHNKLFFNDKIKKYAQKKGILLIPGIEVRVERGQEFIVLMKKPVRKIQNIRTYDALKQFKKEEGKNTVIIAAHPFYPKSLMPITKVKLDVAHAFEYSHFYLKWFNLNKRAVRLARKLEKSMVGTSDMHAFWQMEHTYSMIDCKKDVDSIFSAIKNNQVSVITSPFFWRTFFFNISNLPKELLTNKNK